MLQYMKDNYVFQFILGGVLVSLISYMINQVDQTFASIVWSIPVTLLILVFIMNQSGKSNQTIATIYNYHDLFDHIILFVCLV